MYEQIAANKRRTVFLVAGFVLVFAAAGAAASYLIGFGWYGVIIAFVISGAWPSRRTGSPTPWPCR